MCLRSSIARALLPHTCPALGNDVSDADILTAVVSAIRRHPQYSVQLANLLSAVPGNLTLPKLQQSFAAFGDYVPGAFTVTAVSQPLSAPAAVPPLPIASRPSAAPVDWQSAMADQMLNVVKKVSEVGTAMAITAAKQAHSPSKAPSPAPDRKGPAQRSVAFNTGNRDSNADRRPNDNGRRQDRRPERGDRQDRERSRSPPPRRPVAPHCRNCGSMQHPTRECNLPCDLCGSQDHKLTACPGNKSSMVYDPNWRAPARHGGGSGHDAEMFFADADPFGHLYSDNQPSAELHVVDGGRSAVPPPVPPPRPPTANGMPPPLNTGKHSMLGRYTSPPPTQWTLDGGASHHFCGDIRQLFDVVWDTSPVRVKIANNSYMQRAAVGTLRFITCVNGITHIGTLPEVWYMPGLARNLLSPNQLKKAGNWRMGGVGGDQGELFFTHSSNTPWLYCPSVNGLNVVDWQVLPNPKPASPYDGAEALFADSAPEEPEPAAFVAAPNRATDPETADLWHQRLGHINCRTLSDLVRQRKLLGISVSASALAQAAKHCEVCTLAKHARAPHPPRHTAPTRPMELLHSDECGPYPVRSLGGNVYAMTLLDDFTDYAGVEFYKNKSEAPAALKRLILDWQAKSGHKAGKLFTDRGGGYVDDDFKRWLADHGIAHEFSVPRTPQQNGKAERLNRTLNNMVRAMLLQYNTYLPLWTFAMKYAVHIRNCAMHSRLGITPYEAFHREVPNVAEFRTFGCKVYALANRAADSASKKPGKLDPRSLVGIYLGPAADGPGCLVLIYNPQLKRQLRYAVYTCRDVVTYERLPAVTGTADPAALHWGGPIPLPAPTPAPVVPEQLESLTGGPPTQSRQITQAFDLPTPGAAGPSAFLPAADAPAPLFLPEPGAPSLTGRITRSMTAAGDVPSTNAANTQPLPAADAQTAPAAGMAPGCLPSGPLPSGPSPNHTSAPTAPIPSGPPAATGPPPGFSRSVPPAPVDAPLTRDLSAPTAPSSPASAFWPKHKIARLHEIDATADCADGYAHDPKRSRHAFFEVGTPASPRACAFLAEAPFPQPPAKALPHKADLVAGLLRHFQVPDREGPVPRIADAAKLPVPTTLTEAMQSPYAKEWAEAAVDEWCSLLRNDTWTLVDKQAWMKIIPCRWVFVLKTDAHGVPVRFKARLVAGGHRQTAGVDYAETFAPVARLTSMRMLFALAASRRWQVHQIDITTAFLNGDIDVDVYMSQPPGFVDGYDKVVHLHKCLYGLKQAPRAWYTKLSECLASIGLEPCSADSSLWIGKDTQHPVYIASVVDDMAITTPDPEYTLHIISQILQTFAGKHMGILSHYNGMRVVWLNEGSQCLLLQTAHIEKMAEAFADVADLTVPHAVPIKPGLKLCKGGTSDHPDSPLLDTTVFMFRVLLGILLYIACCTRPDIVYVINQLSRYANSPTVAHWNVLVGVARYLLHTKFWGILLGDTGAADAVYLKHRPRPSTPVASAASAGSGLPPLPAGTHCVGYADANHGTGMDDRRSVSGTVIMVLGGPVSWSSHVQPTQAISTVDSEVYAMSAVSREALWIAKLAGIMGIPARPFLIRGDSLGGIQAVTNYSYTKHTKHIAIHQDFMRDRYRLGDLVFEHIRGEDNPADMFTKALPRPAFEKHRAAIGMAELPESLR